MITFTGIDIVLARSLETEKIHDGVAAALGVEPARVAVIHDIVDYPEERDADVVCVVAPTSGDFVEVVSIQCKAMSVPFSSVLDVVERLSSALGSAVLAPDDGPDPYVMWLVQPHRPPARVSLNEAALDDEKYVIDKSLN